MNRWKEFQRKNHILLNILFTAAVPLVVWLIMDILTVAICGIHTMNSTVDWTTLLRNLISSFCFALALSCNMALGRMDTSAGSQMYMACIFGGNVALALGLGGVGVLGFSMVLGLLIGCFVGLVFVRLKILPMIFGLGVSLVFECISFSAYDQQGLNLFGKPGVGILSNKLFIICASLIIIAVMTFLLQFTSFGYNRRAIQGSQKLAHDAGINIYVNAVICYTIAGGLVAVAGVFDTAYKSNLLPVLGMSSNGLVFANMFPMAIGMWLSKRTNPVIGIFAGALSVQLLTIGLSKFTNVGMSDYMQVCIKYGCWLLFMIYTANESKLHMIKKRRDRLALANQVKRQRAEASA